MANTIRKITKRFAIAPKKLFLIDGIGAFFSAFFLFVILRNFNQYFGMPQTVLTYLAAIAMVFCLYSITCYFTLKDNWAPFLRAISRANLLYCFLTMGLVIYYYPMLTNLGIIYFLVEIILVCVLVFVEQKTLTANAALKAAN